MCQAQPRKTRQDTIIFFQLYVHQTIAHNALLACHPQPVEDDSIHSHTSDGQSIRAEPPKLNLDLNFFPVLDLNQPILS